MLIPKDFDYHFYIQIHPDLIKNGIIKKDDINQHWLNIGYLENRIFKKDIFDIQYPLDIHYYRNKYSDILTLNDNEIMNHWYYTGKKENRICCFKLEQDKKKEQEKKKEKEQEKEKKIYLIITLISYPCGSREMFLLQTMKWSYDIGYKCIWVSFLDKNRKNYSNTNIIFLEYGKLYNISDGYNIDILKDIIIKINPDVVHTHGENSTDIAKILNNFKIPVIVGYHFWNGLIKLNGKKCNVKILENLKLHRIDNRYLELSKIGVTQYVVSEFMNKVLQNFNYPIISNIIYPISDENIYYTDYNPDAKYITIINVSELKGGYLINELVEKINLPFCVIDSEPMSSIELRNNLKKNVEKNGLYLEYTDNIKEIYAKTRILLIPTLVDETFCRVSYESCINGIPLLTTGNGFIKSMIKINELIIDDKDIDSWINKINELYHNKDKRIEISTKLKSDIKFINPSNEINKFCQLLTISYKSPKNNIMILTPWCDQGLGIQSRLYSKLLLSLNYNVYIFAYLPYSCIDKESNMQCNPDEWKCYTDIYYSFNYREHITNTEIRQFVYKYKIGLCLIPETCFFRIFEIAELLKNLYVKCYAIPNVEVVRKSEISKHHIFYKLLAPTYTLIDNLKKYDNFNIFYIGHGAIDNSIIKSISSNNPIIKFIHISGLNAIVRKQTFKIIEAFNFLSSLNLNISLTIIIEGNIPYDIYHKCNSNNIILIDKHLTHKDIIHYYQTHHISIQVSSHEGLGLGFYESISCSTPVISLNTPPHNEVIIPNKTGWLLNCTYKPLTDNNEAIVYGAHFEISDLSDIIIYLSKNIDIVNSMIISTNNMYKSFFTDNHLLKRLIKAFN